MKLILVTLTLMLTLNWGISQVVIGEVKDENNQAVSNAMVYIQVNDVNILGPSTDENGKFVWNSGSIGKYQITVSHVGFEMKTEIFEFLTKKDTFYHTFILDRKGEMDVIEVVYTKPRTTSLGVTSLDRTDFNILPGSFDDPTRLLVKVPAISMANDQSNSIIYRGLPARYTNWSFNGAQIVNPNHLSNAGTSLDIGSSTAGGVNAISGQTINDFTFRGGAGNQLFNTISGTGNINSDAIRKYGQISLLGLESGYKIADFSFGCRYSFTGLLADLGVDFGGEKIGFKDVNFRYSPSWGNNKLIISSTVGDSYNKFKHFDNPSNEKERRDIDYYSDLWISAITFENNKISINTAWSGRIDKRSAINNLSGYSGNSNFRDEKISLNSSLSITDKLVAGIQFLYDLNDYKIFTPERNNDYIIDSFYFNQNAYTISPFADYTVDVSSFLFNARFKPVLYQFYNEISLDFDFSIKRDLKEFGIANLKFGHLSQGSDDFAELFVNAERPVQSWVIEAVHQVTLPSLFTFETSIFRNDIRNLGITNNGFHTFNSTDFNLYNEDILVNPDATARTYGVSFNFEWIKHKSLTFGINSTLFSSQTNQREEWVSSTQDYGYLANIVLGKAWAFKQNTKFLRVGFSAHFRGGAPQYPTQTNLNNLYNQVDFLNGPTSKLSDYYRIDGRLTYQSGRLNISLDIQNMTNKLNDGYFYTEPGQSKLFVQPQLGLVPVLSCRLNFD